MDHVSVVVEDLEAAIAFSPRSACPVEGETGGTRGQDCYLQSSKYYDSVENSGFKNRKSQA
jgi:hypothetical protein